MRAAGRSTPIDLLATRFGRLAPVAPVVGLVGAFPPVPSRCTSTGTGVLASRHRYRPQISPLTPQPHRSLPNNCFLIRRGPVQSLAKRHHAYETSLNILYLYPLNILSFVRGAAPQA